MGRAVGRLRVTRAIRRGSPRRLARFAPLRVAPVPIRATPLNRAQPRSFTRTSCHRPVISTLPAMLPGCRRAQYCECLTDQRPPSPHLARAALTSAAAGIVPTSGNRALSENRIWRIWADFAENRDIPGPSRYGTESGARLVHRGRRSGANTQSTTLPPCSTASDSCSSAPSAPETSAPSAAP